MSCGDLTRIRGCQDSSQRNGSQVTIFMQNLDYQPVSCKIMMAEVTYCSNGSSCIQHPRNEISGSMLAHQRNCYYRRCLSHEARRCIYGSVNWVIIGSTNGLSPVWCQAITLTNDGLLSIGSWFTVNWVLVYCQLGPEKQTSVKS